MDNSRNGREHSQIQFLEVMKVFFFSCMVTTLKSNAALPTICLLFAQMAQVMDHSQNGRRRHLYLYNMHEFKDHFLGKQQEIFRCGRIESTSYAILRFFNHQNLTFFNNTSFTVFTPKEVANCLPLNNRNQEPIKFEIKPLFFAKMKYTVESRNSKLSFVTKLFCYCEIFTIQHVIYGIK